MTRSTHTRAFRWVRGGAIACAAAAMGIAMVAGCGHEPMRIPTPEPSISTAGAPTMPTVEEIRAALGWNNPYGMVPGLTLGPITLPACLPSGEIGGVIPVVADIPGWLVFDDTTYAISLAPTLASGSLVPADATIPARVTYRCTSTSDRSKTALVSFVINDLDGGGAVDGAEYANGEVPLLGGSGWFWLTPGNVSLYRPAAGGIFSIPTGIVKAQRGMGTTDPADDQMDFDGDGLVNALEIQEGTNIFVAGSAGTFSAKADVAVATTTPAGNPTIADFTGDGVLDIAFAASIINSAAVLAGAGDGAFHLREYASVGANPAAVAAADFTRDGRMDLAAVGVTDSNVSIAVMKSDGHFLVLPPISVGAHPGGIAAADFNGDGIVDLAIASTTAGEVTILRGIGDGTFVPRANAAAGAGASAVVAADFDNDGRMDLAVANSTASTVSILLGAGNGSFAAPRDNQVGANPSALVAADLDGDGKVDLAVANEDDGTVSILINNGGGAFQHKQDIPAGDLPTAIVATDIDGDHRIDLAVTNRDANTISVLRAKGYGAFEAPVAYGTAEHPVGLAAADFNGDGVIDLCAVSPSDAISILLGK
jgi:FG-GAP-like repeat